MEICWHIECVVCWRTTMEISHFRFAVLILDAYSVFLLVKQSNLVIQAGYIFSNVTDSNKRPCQ